MIDEILFNDGVGEKRAALVAGGKVQEVLFEREDRPSLLGAIFRGRVTRVVKGLDAAFVDLGGGVTGLLSARDAGGGETRKPIGGLAHEGEALTVEIMRDASGDKGPRLRVVDAPPSAGREPGLLSPAPDLLTRLLRDALTPAIARVVIDSASAFAEARRYASRHKPELSDRLFRHEGGALFSLHDTEAEIARALEPVVALNAGASMTIETTEGMTAIDVNGGGALEGRNARKAALLVNREAAAEIARQLRLRGLGGIVVIDFIHMREREDLAAVIKTLRDALRSDPAPSRVFTTPDLGLVEVTRRATSEPLHRLFLRECRCCGGTGAEPRPASLAYALLRRAEDDARPTGRIAIEASGEIADILRAPREAGSLIERLARRLGRPVEIAPGRAGGAS